MSYGIFLLRGAKEALPALSGIDSERLQDALNELGEELRPSGCRKLSGREGWRIRVGEYRVIYEIDDAAREVTVMDVGHRRDIYR